jgi:glucosamine--fructose-6-phosphate aminotransferase (isomerizing)
MCGIFGVISNEVVLEKTLKGLSRLEYRGYDSAGISILANDHITTLKLVGKVSDLQELISKEKVKDGNMAISHTRWATHGEPSPINAHPHSLGKISLVHNGIIENFQELKDSLLAEGIKFKSSTDSEVILHLLLKEYEKTKDLVNSVRLVTKLLDGSFALLILCSDVDYLLATKKHSSLALGLSSEACYISSDSYSFSTYADTVVHLEDLDIALCHKGSAEIFDQNSKPVSRPISKIDKSLGDYNKGSFKHYMQKEIFEQPFSIKKTIENYFTQDLFQQKHQDLLKNIEYIQIIACGTSLYAGMIAKEWLQNIAKINTTVEIASEFNENSAIRHKNTLGIFISQSGETADTVRALRTFKTTGHKTIGILNTPNSTIAQEVDLELPLFAGPEIGVASTKAFTSQLIVLAALSLHLAKDNNTITSQQLQMYKDEVQTIPGRIAELLNHDEDFENIAKTISSSKSIIYTGRGISYALSLEGALKLKELSYIHAEGIASGELKHGPIALIDKDLYIIAVAPHDHLFYKTRSNLEAMAARKGKLICISTEQGCKELSNISYKSIVINHKHNEAEEMVFPFIYTIPLQLIAYHTAIAKGSNVDQPRNLAKAVTVE